MTRSPETRWCAGDDHVKVSVYEGNDYCWDCIQALIKLLRLRTRTDADDFWPCTSSFSESDTVPFCAWCEDRLAYILTDHGIREEQAHYLEGPPTIPLTRDDAYSLARALDNDDEEFLTAVEGWLAEHDAAGEGKDE